MTLAQMHHNHQLHAIPAMRFERRDLNENINGAPAPVISGKDIRATFAFYMHGGQGAPRVTIVNRSAVRLLVSFQPVNRTGIGGADTTPQHVDAVLDPSPSGSDPRQYVFEGGYFYGFVVVWIDPSTPAPSGAPVLVDVGI